MKIWPKCACVCAQQLQAVLLGAGERLLVAVHHAGGIILHRAQGDEALAHQALARIRHGEFLEVREHARLGVARQNARRQIHAFRYPAARV